MPSARHVLTDRGTRDVQESLTQLQKRLAEASRGPWLALEKVVFGLVRLMNPEKRISRDIDALMTLAARVDAGEDPATLAKDHLESTLRPWELAIVIRTKHPEFHRILEISEHIFAKRLPDFARMAAVVEPTSYPDLVRRAFPDRAHVDTIVRENGADVLALLDRIADHPDMLRIPRSWAPKLMGIAREMVAWKLDAVRREVDEIYADAPIFAT